MNFGTYQSKVNPISVSSSSIPLIAYLDGSDPAANGVLPSDNTAQSSWVSKFGGSNASQGTGANQPKFRTNIQNGKGAVQFTGLSSQFMSIAAGSNYAIAGGQSVYVVARTAGSALSQNLGGRGNFPAGGWNFGKYQTTSEKEAFFVLNNVAVVQTSTGNTFWADNTATCASWVFNPNDIAIYKGSVQSMSPTAVGVPNDSNNALPFNIGYLANGTQYWDGYIMEMLIFKGVHSASITSLVIEYLKNKYNV